ncbi:hypothetical protein ACIQYG_21525 [Peribacillus sp. NPDC096622]
MIKTTIEYVINTTSPISCGAIGISALILVVAKGDAIMIEVLGE